MPCNEKKEMLKMTTKKGMKAARLRAVMKKGK